MSESLIFMALPLIIVIVYGMLHAQKKHYEFLSAQRESHNFSEMNDSLNERLEHFNSSFEDKLKEFDEVKKRVDALVIRAGFKL
jgi:hypothetical protein